MTFESPLPLWEAVDEEGEVTGSWRQTREGGQSQGSPAWIRACRDEWHPGTRLRVTAWTPKVRWDK